MKKSVVVNLYLIRKMLGYETMVETQKAMDESYYKRGWRQRDMNYAEYADYMRNHIANALGILEYTNLHII